MDYIKLLQANDLKVTPQRVLLLKTIDECGHIDIDSLFEFIKKTFLNISLATLYKNVNAMVEQDILREVKLNGFKTKFELLKENHLFSC